MLTKLEIDFVNRTITTEEVLTEADEPCGRDTGYMYKPGVIETNK